MEIQGGDTGMIARGFRVFSAVLLLSSLFAIHAAQRAKVITDTGKKHSVIFLRMHNDTIYLKVPRGDGTSFSISGYKSRFKSVEFANGKHLDFSLHTYPPEYPSEEPSASSSQDTSSWMPLVRTHADSVRIDSSFRADSSALAYLAEKMQSEPERKKEVAAIKESSAGQPEDKKNAVNESASLRIKTAPSHARIYLNDSLIEQKSPVLIGELRPGVCLVRATSGRLEASSVITLKPGQPEELMLKLIDPTRTDNEGKNLTKNHGGGGVGLTILSVALLAGGGTFYYLSTQDRKDAEKAKQYLEASTVPGPVYDQKVQQNKSLTNNAFRKLEIAAGLAGTGGVMLVLGIILSF